MEISSVILGFAIMLMVVLLLSYILIYNNFRKLESKVNESFSGIDVALSKRFNAISNCLEVCKGYCKHEKEVLETIIYLRNKNINELNQTNQTLDQVSQTIVALKENYPKLKADRNFIKLQSLIFDCEEHLQAARRFYNSNVALYNEKIMVFPSSIVAKKNCFVKKEYFKAFNEEKNNIKINY